VKLTDESFENVAKFGYWERKLSIKMLWANKLRACRVHSPTNAFTLI